jgi:serine/threonine-protein kinase
MAKELTQPGELLGDLRFLAPERTRGGELDERSDIYGLGAAVYNILTGRPPFLGDSFTELILAIRRGDILPPQRFQPGIPDDVQAAVVKMLAIEPEHRFASARELLGTLEGLARKHKVPT